MTDYPVTPEDITNLREAIREGRTDVDEAAIRADERRKTAEEIAAALVVVDDVEWALAGRYAGRDAAAIARQIGARHA